MRLENPMAYLVTAGVMAAALFFWDTNSRRDRLDLSVIAEISQSTSHDLSCSSDGRLDDRRAANCFERNGYRFIRDGAGTAIAWVGTDGQTELVYRTNMTKRFGSGRALGEARAALMDNLREQKRSQPR